MWTGSREREAPPTAHGTPQPSHQQPPPVATSTSPRLLRTVAPPRPAPRLPGPTPLPSASPDVPPAPGTPSHTPPALAPHTPSRASTVRRRSAPVYTPWR